MKIKYFGCPQCGTACELKKHIALFLNSTIYAMQCQTCKRNYLVIEETKGEINVTSKN